ncbi:hypothetical protein ZIOFF_010662 [Zingiber officinale]|uniref:NADH dehydrogenase [ubiquinone] iron-sulfur protein 4, mitochondrial n=1 Tax=Zingiber officinale TaxID=94328 RepID=A0A8J5I0X6_ZINOF|nr:hypothetical protein ZIOFF_010662 [Zingiber officinale]
MRSPIRKEEPSRVHQESKSPKRRALNLDPLSLLFLFISFRSCYEGRHGGVSQATSPRPGALCFPLSNEIIRIRCPRRGGARRDRNRVRDPRRAPPSPRICGVDRWENPLMGWTSTGDPYCMVGEAGLTFDSEEAAKAFAVRHGWDYVV